MLIVHSDRELVQVGQAKGFMKGLAKIGRKDPLVLLRGKTHGHRLITIKEVREAADKFFAGHLAPIPTVSNAERLRR